MNDRIPFCQTKAWWLSDIDDPYSESHCAVCGRPVKPDAARILLTRTNDGWWWVLPAERPVADDEKDFGHFLLPIGPDCLRKHPELTPAVLGE